MNGIRLVFQDSWGFIWVGTYNGLNRLSVEEIIERSDAILVESDVWDIIPTFCCHISNNFSLNSKMEAI